MKNELSEEQKAAIAAKRAETIAEIQKKRAESSITVGGYQVCYMDEYNWGLFKEGKLLGYYGDVIQALQSLMRRDIGDRAKGDLRRVLAEVGKCSAAITACIVKHGQPRTIKLTMVPVGK